MDFRTAAHGKPVGMKQKGICLRERQFLGLVASGLWGHPMRGELLEGPLDWDYLLRLARKQTVTGLFYESVALLPAEKRPPREVILGLFASVRQIEQANVRLNAAVEAVVGRYRRAGLEPVLLKGQGVGQYYRDPLRRQPGDIDLYFPTREQFDAANAEAARWEGVLFHEDTTYHRSFDLHGVTVENHVRYADFYAQRNKRAWRRVTEEVPLVGDEAFRFGDFSVSVPCPQMNAVYVFLHLMHHFLQVGVGLRQVCDWLCLLKAKQADIDAAVFARSVRAMGMERAMTALACAAERYMDFPCGLVPFDTGTEQARRDGELMMRDILEVGNFGHGTKVMKNFRRNAHFHNIKSYIWAFQRQLRLRRICPSEVCAYPWVWLKSKL